MELTHAPIDHEALPLSDPAAWLGAQTAQLYALADASRELGRLEATLAALPADEAVGARDRLALIEVEAMLRAQGLIIGRDEIGLDLLEARSGSDPEALRLARWAVRRLAGQGVLTDLGSFLGLHRHAEADALPAPGFDLRPRGWEFDAVAAEFRQAADGLSVLHPLVRGPAVLAAWRRAGLSLAGRGSRRPSGRRVTWPLGVRGWDLSRWAGTVGGSGTVTARPRDALPRIWRLCARAHRTAAR